MDNSKIALTDQKFVELLKQKATNLNDILLLANIGITRSTFQDYYLFREAVRKISHDILRLKTDEIDFHSTK